MEEKQVLRVGDQAIGTRQAKEEFVFSTLRVRGVHGLIQICWAQVLSWHLGDLPETGSWGWMGTAPLCAPSLSPAVPTAVLICMSGKAVLRKKKTLRVWRCQRSLLFDSVKLN